MRDGTVIRLIDGSQSQRWKTIEKFTTPRSDGVWIKKDESESLGRGHNGMRKGFGPRKRGDGEKGRTEKGKRMTGCKSKREWKRNWSNMLMMMREIMLGMYDNPTGRGSHLS